MSRAKGVSDDWKCLQMVQGFFWRQQNISKIRLYGQVDNSANTLKMHGIDNSNW